MIFLTLDQVEQAPACLRNHLQCSSQWSQGPMMVQCCRIAPLPVAPRQPNKLYNPPCCRYVHGTSFREGSCSRKKAALQPNQLRASCLLCVRYILVYIFHGAVTFLGSLLIPNHQYDFFKPSLYSHSTINRQQTLKGWKWQRGPKCYGGEVMRLIYVCWCPSFSKKKY